METKSIGSHLDLALEPFYMLSRAFLTSTYTLRRHGA